MVHCLDLIGAGESLTVDVLVNLDKATTTSYPNIWVYFLIHKAYQVEGEKGSKVVVP